MQDVFFGDFEVLVGAIVRMAENGVGPIVYSFQDYSLVSVQDVGASPLDEGRTVYHAACNFVAGVKFRLHRVAFYYDSKIVFWKAGYNRKPFAFGFGN